MKKTFSLLLCLTLLLGVCLSLSSCRSGAGASPLRPADVMDFEAKYARNDYAYYLFHADGTGEYVIDHRYTQDGVEHIQSATVYFLWREACDGSISLFKTETKCNETNTDGQNIGIIGDPIFFGEDFFYYIHYGYSSVYNLIYVKEGSALNLPE